jgi:hypothetical protein
MAITSGTFQRSSDEQRNTALLVGCLNISSRGNSDNRWTNRHYTVYFSSNSWSDTRIGLESQNLRPGVRSPSRLCCSPASQPAPIDSIVYRPRNVSLGQQTVLATAIGQPMTPIMDTNRQSSSTDSIGQNEYRRSNLSCARYGEIQ